MLDIIRVVINFNIRTVFIEPVYKKREMDTIYQVLIPELAAVILKDDKVIAYGFMMPSINEVMQKGRASNGGVLQVLD